MKKAVHNIGKNMIALIVLSLMLFTGCDLKDDYSNCNPTFKVHLRFSYTLNKDNTDKFVEQVSYTDLFIYDVDGNLYSTLRVNTSDLVEQGTDVDLTKGEYTVVAWGNLDETNYSITDQDVLSKMQVTLKTAAENKVTTQQAALFWGMTYLDVKPKIDIDQTISMIKDVNDIHIIIYEEGTLTSDLSRYTIEITGTNGTYNYDNSKANSDLLQYMPLNGYQTWSEENKRGVEADFRIMRMFIDDDLRIIIRLDDQIVYNKSLTGIICQNPQYSTNEDLDRYDDYTLKFEAKTNGLVLIKVNDWVVQNQNPGI